MKNSVIRIIIFVLFIIFMGILINKDLDVRIYVKSDKQINYSETTYLKDIIDFRINSDNSLIDTSILGRNKITTSEKTNNESIEYIIEYTVTDTEAPIIMGSSTHTIQKGQNIDLVNTMLCGDNYDKRPNCYIEGEYDINKLGTYNLKYIAIDSSKNKTERDYTLVVKSRTNISKNEQSNILTPISDIIDKHKNSDTMVGIDVSSWQGDIDWNKVKSSGVEFAIIRIGFGYNSNNELIYDSKFKNNLANAKKAGIKVGLYFYSYAKSNKEAINQAKWIIDTLDEEKLDLPVAFDWETWTKFNTYNISFTDLNNIATSFMDELSKNNYEGMIYGSCSYLERIWKLDNYKTWLAHYTDKTDYTKDYYIWQLSSTGKVDGINGAVDLDILYKK